MKVYKWCIKENNHYFPLINFEIFPIIHLKLPSYKLERIYTEYYDLLPSRKEKHLLNTCGFHFFKNPKPIVWWDRYNNFLAGRHQPTINAILECKINEEDILFENKEQVVTTKFKTLKELSL